MFLALFRVIQVRDRPIVCLTILTLVIERNGFIDWLRGSQNVANSNCYSLLRSHSSGRLSRLSSSQRTAAPEITIISEFRPSEKPLIVHSIRYNPFFAIWKQRIAMKCRNNNTKVITTTKLNKGKYRIESTRNHTKLLFILSPKENCVKIKNQYQ